MLGTPPAGVTRLLPFLLVAGGQWIGSDLNRHLPACKADAFPLSYQPIGSGDRI